MKTKHILQVATPLMMCFAFMVSAQPSERGERLPLVPILTCSVFTESAIRVVAILGYMNPNPETVSIPVGPSNFFNPSPADRDQPITFEPGIHPTAFFVQFNPNFEVSLDWNLDGTAVRIKRDPTKACHPSVLSLAVSGSGSISADPVIPACTDACSAPVAGPATLQLAAIPVSGWSFAGYAGDDDCLDGEVTMGAGGLVSCQAVFQPPALQTLAVAVFGNGRVTSTAGGIDCPSAACIANLPENSSVGLTALPGSDSFFLGWAGDPDCMDGTVLLDTGTVCTAVFDPGVVFRDGFEFIE